MGHSVQTQRGFTLIEMAVVLTVIALIIGGVMVGQSMIRTSQVNSVQTEKEKLAAGFTQFREKYNALPGDMPNASEYWGLLHFTPATCYNMAPGSDASTCNGTGNGRIWPVDGAESATSKFESFRAWQHLANAKMVDKSFTGRDEDGNSNDASSQYVPNVNVPGSKVDGGYFVVRDLGRLNNPALPYFNTGYFHAIIHNNTITSDEAYNLDKKFDDGKPAFGNIKEVRRDAGASLTCTSSAVESTAEYTRSGSDTCTLHFLLGY